MSTVYEREIRLFSLNSNRPLAEEIAKEIGIPLSDCQVKRFSDGELYINIEESVRGDDVYIIQSTSSPVNETLMELLVMIDALKRASVRTINVVMPYYGYARQDRKARSREPITAKLVAESIDGCRCHTFNHDGLARCSNPRFLQYPSRPIVRCSTHLDVF